MTFSTCERALYALSLRSLMIVFIGGCAPTQFGPAIAHYAEKTAVTDAAARHTAASPYYRFNSALLSDLDDALARIGTRRRREMATAVLQGASALARASAGNEIERMPRNTRKQLAALAGVDPSTSALQRRFTELAGAALAQDLRDVAQIPDAGLRRKLRAIRNGVVDLPDDRGRALRRFLYSWGALVTAGGIASEEAKLPEKCLAKVEKKFDRIAIWRPPKSTRSDLIERYAPIIGVEWPRRRHYYTGYDRLGAVILSTDEWGIQVHIDSANPTVYAYTTEAKVNGRRLRQLNYVWWFEGRPAMIPGDPVAGHIDGAMIRVTLDDHDDPIFIESSLNCGCAHEVFVSERVESAARKAFGPPLAGKHFSVEKPLPNKHDVVVIHTFRARSHAAHPLLLSGAGNHEVYQVQFDAAESMDSPDVAFLRVAPPHVGFPHAGSPHRGFMRAGFMHAGLMYAGFMRLAEDSTYRIVDYETLDRLPLGDGVASMFGADGLVHRAGRPEGYLLVPSGILSAGQPRKRGTQRIRWDDFLHDDPHLLEKTLRIPPLD